jgi:hypothetical protein
VTGPEWADRLVREVRPSSFPELAGPNIRLRPFVQRHAPVLNQRIRYEMRHRNRSRRIDETHVTVAAAWAYLYRAIDSSGETIEFMLSPKRDLIAAKLFLRLAFQRRTIAARDQRGWLSGVRQRDP